MGPVIVGTAWSILWRVLLFVLVFGLFGALLIIPFDPVLAEWRGAFPMRAHLYGQSASALAVLAATWTMTRFVDRRPFRTIGFAPGRVLRDLAMGFALAAAWLATSLAALWAFGWVSREDPSAVSATLLLVSAIAVLLNALTQQLLLFGYILQTIRSRAGFPLALLLSAAAFSGVHAGGFQGEWLPAVNVFGAGALFCLAYAVTGNLWLPVAAHFTWNLVLGPVLGLTVSGSSQLSLGWRVLSVEGPPLITGGDFGPEGGLMVTLTTALLVAAMLWLHNRRPASGPPETSPGTP